MFEFARGFLWFDKGELDEIVQKYRSKTKYQYETYWEGTVLAALFFGVLFAFSVGHWMGILELWFAKIAVQALNHKKFFDPRDHPDVSMGK